MDPSDHHRNDLRSGAPDGGHEPTHANVGQPGEDVLWLRSALRNASEVVKVVDPDGTLRYASPAFEKVLGYDPAEAAGKMNVLDLVHPEDLPRVLEETERALADESVATNIAEYRFRHKDGSWRWVESVGTYLLDDPDVRGVVVNVRDVTRRKEAEERLGALMENAQDFVVLADEGNVALYASPSIERVLGYAPEEFVGTVIADYVHSDDLERTLEKVAETLPVPGPHHLGTIRYRRKDGSIVHLEVVANNRLDDPALRGVVCNCRDVTERVAAEKALRESEEFHRALNENALDLVLIQGPDSTLAYASPSVRRLLGYDPEEEIGKRLEYFIHPEDLEWAWPVFHEQLQNPGVNEPVTIRYRHKDGSWRWFESVCNNQLDNPAVGGLVFNCRDITQRVEAEERLKEAEERYRTLVERGPAMSYIHHQVPGGLSGAIYVSPQVETVLGYTPEEYTADPEFWKSIVHPDDRERVLADDERTGATGEPFDLDFRMITKDGRVVWLRESGMLVRTGYDGKQIWQGIMLDISELKRVEGELREAEERYRLLVEQIPAVAYADSATAADVAIYTSPRIESLLGYTPEEWIGEDLWKERLHPEDRDWVIEEDDRARAAKEPFGEEYRLIARDGRTVWVRDESELLRDEEGRPLLWQGLLIDVTERKQAEEAVRRSEERLRGLADSAFEGILISDGGDILEANRALTDMLGYELAEVVGRSALEFVAPEHRDLVRGKIASGAEEPYEIVGVRKDGTSLDLEVRGRAFSYRGRSVRVTAVRDVTGRKAAERRLMEAEERYRTLVERIPAVTFVDRADGSEESLYVSPQVKSMLGYTPEEWAAGKLWRERLHPDDRDAVLASDERFEADGEPVDQEYRLLAKDGSTVWVHEETVLVRDEAGEPQFVQGIMSDVTQKKRSEERLHHLAFHDHLTGLPNRRLFVDHLRQALQRTRRRGNQVAVLFMDLDDFKFVNDSLGHDVGDLLLTVVAQRLGRCLRPEDTLARFGGDEFVVLLEEIDDAAEAVRVSERITEELRRPFFLEGKQLYAAASIGVSLGHARTYGPEGLIREADTAMYRAKAESCNYCVFDPTMHERALGRLELENDLRRAIEEGEFVVHYQPIVNLQTGAVSGVEALVRWEHPERGLLDPNEFVPVAEESGLVVPMGEMVLEEACRRAIQWQREFPLTPPLAVSVNLSGSQLRRPDLHEVVGRALAETGLPASSLGLDITETVYIGALEANTAALDRLTALGVRVSLDDFGSGYSSLSYLKRLPTDILKIDRSFTKGLGLEVEDTAIVRTVVDLAHILGMEVVAEGVEIAEQETLLKEMGCDFGQGYHFSRPLPPEEASKFLRSAYRGVEQRDNLDSLSDSN